jgi:hypothetical protein
MSPFRGLYSYMLDGVDPTYTILVQPTPLTNQVARREILFECMYHPKKVG